MKYIILALVALAVCLPLVNALPGEECGPYDTCPPGNVLNSSCLCEPAGEEEGETVTEGTGLDINGTGFEASGGGAQTTQGFLNIIYSFQSSMFVWILLFILFLIALGVLIKFISALTR